MANPRPLGNEFSVPNTVSSRWKLQDMMTYLLAPVTSAYKDLVLLPLCILQLSEFVDRLDFWLKTDEENRRLKFPD